MSSFKHFLLNENIIRAGPRKAAEMVFKDCQPFLKEMNYRAYSDRDYNRYLYRGMTVGYMDFPFLIKQDVNQQREPKDMPIEYHLALDDYLREKFGIRYRSAALFATGSERAARDYGTPFVIFPIGEFKFIWEERIRDAWEDLVSSKIHLQDYTKYLPPSKSEDPVEIFSQMLRVENFYEDTNLIDAILSNNEIMISCKEYYAVTTDVDSYCQDFKDHIRDLMI